MAKKTLLAHAKTVSIKKKTPNWFDKLSPELREQVAELMESYVSGELERTTGQPWTATDLNRLVLAPNGIRIAENTFRKWVASYGKDAAGTSRKGTA